MWMYSVCYVQEEYMRLYCIGLYIYTINILYWLLFVEQPLEQLPVYTCEDGELVMSNSIARYVAKKFGKKNKWQYMR